MSGLKRNHEDVDPDYADASNQQNKRQRALEEEAKLVVCQRIQNIIKSEFHKEINNKESELQQVDKRLGEARLMMDRLRACVVATYYGQINSASFAQPTNAHAPPPSIHPTVKKFIGKAPSSQDSFTASSESNHVQEISEENLKSKSVGHEIKPKSNLTGSSSSSQHPSLTATGNTNAASKPSIPDSMAYDDRRSRFKIKTKIIVGNVSKYIPVDHREANDMSSHKWMVYVRGPRSTPDISGFVKKVWFFLHHSYKPNDLVEISSPPFQLTRRGWGEFPVRVQLHFVDPRNKKVDVIHHLKLDKTFTGLQTPGAETVVEVELEKDFFGMVDTNTMNGSLPAQCAPQFTMKPVSYSDRTLEKLARGGSQGGAYSDTNDISPSATANEPPREMKDASNNVIPEDCTVSARDDYNVTIAHEDSEDNVVDVGGDIKPTASDLVSYGSSVLEPKQTLTVAEDSGLVEQEKKVLASESARQNNQPNDPNIVTALNTCNGETPVVKNEQAFTMITPVSSMATSLSSSQQSAAVSRPNVSQGNIIIVPTAKRPTVSTSNITIVDGTSLVAGKQTDTLPAVQKLILLNSYSQATSKLETTSPAVNRPQFLLQASTIRQPQILLQAPAVRQAQILQQTSVVRQPQIVQQQMSVVRQPQIVQQQMSVVRQPQIVQQQMSVVRQPQIVQQQLSVVRQPQIVQQQTPVVRPTAPKQVSLLTGKIVDSSQAALQHIIPSTPQNPTSLLLQRPKQLNTANQTLILNKGTNQFVLLNNSLPQTIEPANQLADLNGHVSYPSESPYPVAVRVANPFTASMRLPKQFSLLKNMNFSTSSGAVPQAASSATQIPQSSLATLSSLDPLLTCPKMSAVGITKHGRNYLKTMPIKIERTEEERKQGQYEVLKAWKENPALYERGSVKAKKNFLLARDLIEGEAEDIPELITEDYPSMATLIKDSVKLHPLIQENVNKLTHPYCAKSLDQWSSWPIGKQRACEWHRACFVLKYLKSCLKNKTEFRGEKLKSTRELVKWCRLHAFTPAFSIPTFHPSKSEDTETNVNTVDYTNNLSSFTPVGDLERELTSYQINGDTEDVELDIVATESDRLQCKVKKEPEDGDCVSKASIQYLTSSEGSSFVDEQLRKRGLRLEPTELETGIYSLTVMDMLYKVMLEFTSDILREASSVMSQTQKSTDQVLTRQVVHSALSNLPEAGFCCDTFLGKEDEENIR